MSEPVRGFITVDDHVFLKRGLARGQKVECLCADVIVMTSKIIPTVEWEQQKKIAVIGKVNVKIFVHSAHGNSFYGIEKAIPFSTSLFIPDDTSQDQQVSIRCHVEDAQATLINPRQIYVNVAFACEYDERYVRKNNEFK